MGKDVILIGAGGHAVSLAEFAGDRIAGYLSKEPNSEMPGEWFGDDSRLDKLMGKDYRFHVAYIYAGWPVMDKRADLIREYENRGVEFVTLVSPHAVVTPHSEINDGCALMTGCIINRATLGRHVVVNSGAIVEHDCIVGENSFIGPGAVIGGFTEIGRNCFIGLGARIGNGLKIGDNITVGMGAIVSRNLIEPGIYHGTPLRRYKI